MRVIPMLFLLSSLSQRPFAQSSIPVPQLWGANGKVDVILRTGNTVYLGGDFTRVAPNLPFGAALDAGTGKPDVSFVKPNSTIFAAVPDGSGGFFIGGNFNSVNGYTRNHIARINADGSLHPWNPDASSLVRAIAVVNGMVYIGGDFHSVGGQARNHLAAVDSETGLLNPFDPNPNNSVFALAFKDGTLYAGGSFTVVGGQTRNRMAAIDSASGVPTAWNPNANNFVYALSVSGKTVYAGGAFSMIGGQIHQRIAAIDIVTGSPNAWSISASMTVRCLATDDGIVYAGGDFTGIAGDVRSRIAAIDSSTGQLTPWNPTANGTVYTLSVSDGIVYAGGEFSQIGGMPRNHLAALQTTSGNATGWDPNVDKTVRAIAIGNGVVYAGGSFGLVGGEERRYIAALDASTGAATPWNPGADDEVLAIAVSEGTVYAGGFFNTVGGQPRNRIAAIDSATGSITPWNPAADNAVRTLAADGGTVYAGGSFNIIGGQSRNHIAAIDAGTGSATSWNPDADGTVYTLAMGGGKVYAGGYFTFIGGQPRSRIAAVDKTTGTSTPWNPMADDAVRTLALYEGRLYAGGFFNSIGGSIRGYIAALDTSTGSATSWAANANSVVYALAAGEGRVFAEGDFSSIGGAYRTWVAAMDTSVGNATPWHPNPNDRVWSLAVGGGMVYVGGEFSRIGGEYKSGFAGFAFSDVCTNPLDGGAIAVSQEGVAPFNPSAFTSFSPASGYTGTVQYKWQSSITGGSSGFSDVAGATSETYDPGPLTQTTWFKRLARVDCKADWSGAGESNVLKVDVTPVKTWVGGTGDWNVGANWSDSKVPVYSDIITINEGNPKLNVDFMAMGSLTVSGTGGLTINPGKTLSVGGTVDFGGRPVILLSDALGTAQLGEVAGTLSNATNVTVERYIPNTGRRWRLLTAPLDDVTINGGWQNGQTWNGTSALSGTSGTLITGQQQGSSSTANGRGFDFWSAIANSSASVMSYTQRSGQGLWTPLTSTTSSNAFNGNKAYLLFVRGPRHSLYSTGTANAATTLRPTGKLRQGNIDAWVDGTKGFTLVGNPYASQVDFDKIYQNTGNSAVIKRQFWMWDATSGTSGNFQAVVYSGDRYVEVPMKFHASGQSTPLTAIQSGHGFFVLPLTTAGGMMRIRESNKVDAPSASPNILLSDDKTPRVFVSLMKRDEEGRDVLADGVMVAYGEGYSMQATDADDALKLENLGENLAVVNGDDRLIADARPMSDIQRPVELRLWNARPGRYRFEAKAEGMAERGIKAFLEDRLTGQRTPMEMKGDVTLIEMVLGEDNASKAEDRFRIVFEKALLNASLTPEEETGGRKMTVFPNPLTDGRSLAVRLQGLPAGSYTLQLTASDGRLVATRRVVHGEGTGTYRIGWDSVLPKGNYLLRCMRGIETIDSAGVVMQ